MSFSARLKYIVLSVLFIVATINFTRTTIQIFESSKRLDNSRNEVLNLETRKIYLQNDLKYKKSDEYVEEKARNDLNLIKPGERIFVVSKVLGKFASGKNENSIFKTDTEKSNLELWIEFLF